ncbi:MAG: hypothetical protein HOL01_09690 [Planctomycetaceae bacterium]|jgi:DMSO/TMAO reductase YedYZ heme-binding membrane subunit|nr:hypothetical protein [Planctomycetaceae bacterium]MBT6486862.1 hypothetical protein [Planctomycetaceae bacterium]MBT6494809.1 hypothetical protein [Planctomycetaceae bacterium]
MNLEDDTSQSPEGRLWRSVTTKWFGVIFGTALAYAILRYHIAGDVSWTQFPLFILNKAMSLAAVAFVACSYLVGRVIRWHNEDPQTKLVVIKFCGLMGLSLAAIHALCSMCLLTPAYYAKFYGPDGRLNFTGGLGLAVGVVALWALVVPAITTLPTMPKALGGIRWKRTQRVGYLCLGLVIAHMVAFGLKGWMTPEKWHWGLPPITLWGALAAAVPIAAKSWQLCRRQK